jgi:hypothetical protein
MATHTVISVGWPFTVRDSVARRNINEAVYGSSGKLNVKNVKDTNALSF